MRRDIDRSVTSGAPDCAPLRFDLHRIAQRDPAGRYGRAVGKVSGWSDPDNFNTRYNFACALSVHLMDRSEEHTSELQSIMSLSYAVFCLKQKPRQHTNKTT